MTFQYGISGNPNGRPKGTGHRQKIFNTLIAPHKEALIDTAIKLALNGNEAMLRLFLERILPAKPQDEPVNLELPEDITKADSLLTISEKILRAMEKQEITPEQCTTLFSALKNYRENIIADDLNKRLCVLEGRRSGLTQNR